MGGKAQIHPLYSSAAVTTPLRLALIFLCAAPLIAQTPPPASTAVTVAQLQQLLAQKQRDSALATQLESLVLTQRLSLATLATLRAALPGNKSRNALTVLADRSIFLAAPPFPVAPPPPDLAEQRRIMAHAVDYVAAAVHKLPNFFATRTTTQFVDWPKNLQIGDQVPGRNIPLEAQIALSNIVTYRNGNEVVDAPKTTGRRRRYVSAAPGLTTRGIFGPILSIVLVDAAHGTAAWDRWEPPESASGSTTAPIAVFRYTVPMEKSTYFVNYCCRHVTDKYFVPIDRRSAYHGEIAIDPSTGVILRITVVADLDRGDTATLLDEAASGESLLQADLAVEYGPVSIGSIPYTCPVRSVAVSRVRTQTAMTSDTATLYGTGPIRTYLNDVTFTDYHLFRSESRILIPPATTQPTTQP